MSAPRLQPVIDAEQLDSFCALLKMLANPQRFRILSFLENREASVGEIETELKIKQPNLSHELRKLRDCGVVATRRQSKVVFYSLADAGTRALVENINILAQQAATKSNARLDLKPALAKPRTKREAASSAECGVFPVISSAGQ